MTDTPKTRDELVEWLDLWMGPTSPPEDPRDGGEALLADLESHGVRLVPAEPTALMRSVGFYEADACHESKCLDMGKHTYAAMLAASPFAPKDKR